MLTNTVDGHGTPVAGVIAQFVPQATIVPVNIFVPFLIPTGPVRRTGGGGGGGAGGDRRRRRRRIGSASADQPTP